MLSARHLAVWFKALLPDPPHMTLNGYLTRERQDAVQDRTKSVFTSVIPSPFSIDAFTLLGERLDGKFELVQGHSLEQAAPSS